MGGLDDLQPLLRLQLVGANDGPDIVIENFGRGTGKAAEPGLLELCQKRCNGSLQSRRPLPYLQRREGMDVQSRRDILDGAADREIGRSGVIRMNSTLQTHFRRAALPCLLAAALNLIKTKVIWPPAQVGGELAFRKRA